MKEITDRRVSLLGIQQAVNHIGCIRRIGVITQDAGILVSFGIQEQLPRDRLVLLVGKVGFLLLVRFFQSYVAANFKWEVPPILDICCPNKGHMDEIKTRNMVRNKKKSENSPI